MANERPRRPRVALEVQRHNHTQADVVDYLFNASEKWLAQAHLVLARFAKKDNPEEVIPDVTQDTLTKMIITISSRINLFVHKSRKPGFIGCNDRLRTHTSLLSIVLHG